MSRISSDTIDAQGIVKDGFDYELQVWVRDYIVQDCGHRHFGAACCNAHILRRQDIRKIPDHECRERG